VTEHPRTRFARLYLHLYVTAACVVPVASYLLSTFGWRAGDIGVGTALVGIAGTIASPLWGRLDDRTTWAPRAAILSSAGAIVLAALTLGRVPHWVTWVALAAYGVGQGPLDALLTTRVLADRSLAARLGALRSLGSLGWVVGLAIAAAVLTLWPEHSEWVLFAAAVAAVTAPRSWGRRHAPSALDGPPGTGGLPLRAVSRVLVFTVGTPIVMSALVQFTAGWAHQELAAGPFLALAPIALSAALELPAFPWVDRLARGRSPLALAALAGPPLALSTALLAAFPSRVTVLAVQPLVAVSFSLWYVAQSRMLAAAVPAGQQASAQTLGSALSIGCSSLLAGVVGGQLADAVGYGGLFATLAAVAMAGSAAGTVALLRQRWTRRAAADAGPAVPAGPGPGVGQRRGPAGEHAADPTTPAAAEPPAG
jgi:MFS transporter, PPP family, 3-phenylpropionic acid transporter